MKNVQVDYCQNLACWALERQCVQHSRLPTLEEYQSKMTSYSISQQGNEEITSELFTRLPVGVGGNEVVNLIFEYARDDQERLIDIFLSTYPATVLSQLNQKRLSIIKDDHDELDNEILVELDERERQACYDLAYQYNRPNIYQVTSEPHITFTINFLWVNLNPQDRVRNVANTIFGVGEVPIENAPEMDKITRWAAKNRGARINLWFDSALVTHKAWQNTLERAQAISLFCGVDLQLRDVRTLPNIPEEIRHALHPGTPLYFRVDILKALIADYMITSSDEKAQYCVVTDMDVTPMNLEHLFDQRTRRYLEETGYVFSKANGRFENNFFIFNRRHARLQEEHRTTVIDAVAHDITNLRQYPVGACTSPFGSQFVFYKYSNFLQRMGEMATGLCPRKPIQCPSSRFNGSFTPKDIESEIFRFIGESNIPYTLNGRNHKQRKESPIAALANWRTELIA